MTGWSRAATTLAGAAIAGFMLWLAAQFDSATTGGYWAAMGVTAAGGLILGLASLRGRGGDPLRMFLVAFLPVVFVGCWVLTVGQPQSTSLRDHFRAWDGHLGIGGTVTDIATSASAVAFAIGIVLGLTLEPRRAERPVRTDVEPGPVPLSVEPFSSEVDPEPPSARDGDDVVEAGDGAERPTEVTPVPSVPSAR